VSRTSGREPVVIDTDVFSAGLQGPSLIASFANAPGLTLETLGGD